MSKIQSGGIVSWAVALAAAVAAGGIALRWFTTCDAWIAWVGIFLSGLIALYTQLAEYKEVEDGSEPSALEKALDNLGRKSIKRDFEARVKRFKIMIRFALAVIAALAVGTNSFLIDPACKAVDIELPATRSPSEQPSQSAPENTAGQTYNSHHSSFWGFRGRNT